jgi:hypothetical protein
MAGIGGIVDLRTRLQQGRLGLDFLGVWACSMGGVVDWAADLRRRVRTIQVDGADSASGEGMLF